MPSHPFCEEILPDVPPEPALAQLEAIPYHLVTGCLGEEANSPLTTAHSRFHSFLTRGDIPRKHKSLSLVEPCSGKYGGL